MADDVRLTYKADLKAIKKASKEASGLADQFAKFQKKANDRIAKHTIKTEDRIKRNRFEALNARARAESRLSRLIQKQNERRRRDAIRQEKREARERERVLKAHAAQRWRIMRGAGRMLTRGAGLFSLGGGIGAVYAAREVLRFEESLARASAQANISVKRQMEIKKAFGDTSIEVGVHRDRLGEYMETVVDLTGNIELAAGSVNKIGKIMRGTKSEARDLGSFMSALADAFPNKNVNELTDMMEMLIAQGDEAKINIAALSTEGANLFGSFLGKGLKGMKSFKEYGAFLQIAAKGAGSAAETSTQITRFLDALVKQEKVLGKVGVKVFNKGADGKKQMRDIGDIIKDVMKATGGDISKLKILFPNIRALNAVQVLAQNWDNVNQELKIMDDLVGVADDHANNIERKYSRVAKTASQGFGQLSSAIAVLSDEALQKTLKGISEGIIAIIKDPEKMKEFNDLARDLGDTLWLIAKAGGAAGKAIRWIVTPFNKDKANEHKRRIREHYTGSKTSRTEQSIGGVGSSEQSVGNVSVGVNNVINVDNAGNVLGTVTTVETQQNTDRGVE